jgi:hypothetical protein
MDGYCLYAPCHTKVMIVTRVALGETYDCTAFHNAVVFATEPPRNNFIYDG